MISFPTQGLAWLSNLVHGITLWHCGVAVVLGPNGKQSKAKRVESGFSVVIGL